MNKLVPIVIAGVVVVGGGVFLMTRGESGTNKTGSNSAASQAAAKFNAVSTDGVSFRATIETVAKGKTLKSVMESDAKTGATRYASDTNGAAFTMIYTKDAYYMCQGGENCYKYEIGKGTGASFNPKDYQYDSSKIDKYKSNTKSLGRQSCSTGTCEVWQVSSDKVTSKIYIDTNTRRVVQAVTEGSDTKSTVTYEYPSDISVSIPDNAKTIPTTTGLGQ